MGNAEVMMPTRDQLAAQFPVAPLVDWEAVATWITNNNLMHGDTFNWDKFNRMRGIEKYNPDTVRAYLTRSRSPRA